MIKSSPKLSKAKGKKEEKKHFRRRENLTAGAHKNWPEWCRRYDRRWNKYTLSLEEEAVEEIRGRREGTLPKTKVSTQLS